MNKDKIDKHKNSDDLYLTDNYSIETARHLDKDYKTIHQIPLKRTRIDQDGQTQAKR